jgi:hypothetical protein
VFKQVNKLLLFLALLWALTPQSTQAQVINCPSGFASTGDCGVGVFAGGQSFQLNGGPNGSSPGLSGSQILLLPTGADHVAMSLNYQTQVDDQAFTASFTFVPNGQNVSFMIQNSNNNPSFNGADFSNGAGCEASIFQGFSQTNPPNNIFGLELDSYSPLTNAGSFTYSSAQIYWSPAGGFIDCPCLPISECGVNNNPTAIDKISTSPVPLNSPAGTLNTTTGDTYSATVTYDGSNFTLNLFDVTAGGSCPGSSCFTNTWTDVDIPSYVGGNTAWVGLTGATGIPSSYPLYINSFVYNVGTPTSTPTHTPTPTVTTNHTPTPTATATVPATLTPTPNPPLTPTPNSTATPAPTAPPTLTPTPNPPLIPTPSSTATPAPKVSAVVSMSRSSVNFGTVKVGKSRIRVVKLTNTAKKKTETVVTFAGATVAGSNEFSASTSCAGSVGPKGKCSVGIGFAPTVPGAVSATVTVNGNASNSPQTIGVTGTGK